MAISKDVICDACDGFGGAKDAIEICPMCNGTVRMDAVVHMVFDDDECLINGCCRASGFKSVK